MDTRHGTSIDTDDNSRRERARATAVSANNRSRITNGVLPVDLRTAAGRRWRDVYQDTIQRTNGRNDQLARAYATAVVLRERIDADVGAGRSCDVDLMLRCTSEVRRLQERLGLIETAADDQLIEDTTEAAIAAARAHINGKAA